MDTITRKKVYYPALTIMAYEAIKTLEKTGRTSQVIHQGPRPLLPARSGDWELSEVVDEDTLPFEVRRRINILRNDEFPIKQVLVAHERPLQLLAPKETSTVRPPDAPKTVEKEKKVSILTSDDLTTIVRTVAITGTILSLIVGSVLALAAFIVFLPVLAGLASAAIIPVVLIGGLLLGCGTDPLAIVVLDDQDEYGNPVESWLMIGMWYE